MTARLARLLVALSAPLVPRSGRAAWREEWHAELASCSAPGLHRAVGVPVDALAIRLLAIDPMTLLAPGWRFDLRDALRALRRTPLQSGAMLCCLTIGILTTIIVFGLLNTILGGPLPGIRHREELVTVGGIRAGGAGRSSLTNGDFRLLPDAIPGLASYGGEAGWRFSVHADGRAVAVEGAFVSGAYFSTLGTEPALGRLLHPDDDRPDADPVLVLGHGFWRRHFGGRADVLDATVYVGPSAYRIVGVAPAGFTGLDHGDPGERAGERRAIWLPMAHRWTYPGRAGGIPESIGPLVVARLADGVTRERAEASAQAILPVLNGGRAAASPLQAVRLSPFIWVDDDVSVGWLTLMLSLVMAVPLVVLAIACANIAGVQLARAAGRTHELAIRAAQGASRQRILRLLLLETSIIAFAAGAIAWGLATQVLRLSGDVLPFVVTSDARVLAFAIAVPALVVLLAGLAPAWRGSGTDVLSGLRPGARGGGVAGMRLRRTVVGVQVALSVALLVSGAWMVKAIQTLPGAIGPARDDLLVAAVRVRDLDWTAGRTHGTVQVLTSRLVATAGVTGVAVSPASVFDRFSGPSLCEPADSASGEVLPTTTVTPAGSDAAAMVLARLRTARAVKHVSASYFEVVGIQVVRGRTFTEGERAAVIVNEAFLRRLDTGQLGLGSGIRLFEPGGATRMTEIVGVVEDSYERAPRGTPSPMCYVALDETDWQGAFAVYVRARDAGGLASLVERTLTEIDPQLSAYEIGTVHALMQRKYRWLWWLTTGAIAVAGLALLLAAVGLFGVIAYHTAMRSHEFSVRLALGARPHALVASVLGESLGVTIAGAAAGLLFAVPAGLAMRDIVLDPLPLWHPAVPGMVLGTVLVTAVVAALLPALRTARTDAIQALRAE